MEKITSFFKSLSPTAWIIIAIVVLLVIALIIYLNSQSKKAASKDTISANNNLQTNTNAAQTRSVFPLQYGSKGNEVKTLQLYLNSKGEKLVVDGIWGPSTNISALKVLKVNTIPEDLYKTLTFPSKV